MNELIKRIEALEEWKRQREQQQLTQPLDPQTVEIINQYFMRITGSVLTSGGASGNNFTTYIGEQNGQEFELGANTFIPYTVDATSNVFSIVGSPYTFEDDTSVYVTSGTVSPPNNSVPPAPLVANTEYFVINPSGQTFQLSATSGGAAINITDTGTGRQFIYFYQ
jgi:hypothetical protein